MLIRSPVEFPLYVSSTQLTVKAGDLLPVDPEQMTPLPPIRTVLQAGKKSDVADRVTVELHARRTEIGTLDLWCSEPANGRTWKLQFDVRAATQTDRTGHGGSGERLGIIDESILAACRELVQDTFAKTRENREQIKPEQLARRLAETIGLSRAAWPPSLLRELWARSWKWRRDESKAPRTKPAGLAWRDLRCGPATAWRWTIGEWARCAER